MTTSAAKWSSAAVTPPASPRLVCAMVTSSQQRITPAGNGSTNKRQAASEQGGGHLATWPSCNGTFTQLTADLFKSVEPMSLGMRTVHAEQLRQGIGSFTGCDAFGDAGRTRRVRFSDGSGSAGNPNGQLPGLGVPSSSLIRVEREPSQLQSELASSQETRIKKIGTAGIPEQAMHQLEQGITRH